MRIQPILGKTVDPGISLVNERSFFPYLSQTSRHWADFLEAQSIADSAGGRRVHISALWHVLIDGLAAIWPASRTTLGGTPLGDVWPCEALRGSKSHFSEGDDLVPFHKLTGWTTYSLLEPMQVILKWKFDGLEDLTGLPEYRNGQLPITLSAFAGLITDKEGKLFRWSLLGSRRPRVTTRRNPPLPLS